MIVFICKYSCTSKVEINLIINMGMFQANVNSQTSTQWQNMSTLWCMQNLVINCFVHRLNILNNHDSEYVCPLTLTNQLTRISSYTLCYLVSRKEEKGRNNRCWTLVLFTLLNTEGSYKENDQEQYFCKIESFHIFLFKWEENRT